MSQKFCASKKAKKEKTHPKKPEKGKTGCVLGAGGDESGCRQVQTDAKSRYLNQCEHHNHTTHRKRKPAETQCFRRFFGRGRRTRSALPLRSARSLRATGTHSPLGTRFWSGCGNTPARAGKGKCCRVLTKKLQKSDADLVLRGIFKVRVLPKDGGKNHKSTFQ
jgi:hypothetical protein